jgi:hypothetical protein
MRDIYCRLNRRTESPPHSAISTANARRKIPIEGKSNRRKAPMRKKGMLRAKGLNGEEAVSLAGGGSSPTVVSVSPCKRLTA